MTSRGSHSVSTAAVELADYLVAAVEPETSTGVVELRLSQRQIALDRGVSVGTIHQHLTSLSDLGVRVSSRPLRLDLKRLAEIKRRGHLHIVTDESASHSPVAAQSEEATGPSSAASALPDPWATPAVAALYELASIAMAELGPDAAPVIEKIAAQIVEVMTSGVREQSPTRSRKPQAEQSNERSRGPARGQPREKPREKTARSRDFFS